MVDPELVAIGAKAPARLTDLGVMPEPGGEGEEPQPDAGAQVRECAVAVALEAELSLAGPKDRFDPLAHAPERSESERLVLAIGTKELGSAIGHPALELGAGEALVGDDGEAGERDPLEHLARDLSLGSICRGELEGDRGPVARAEQIEAKAPEVARVRAAVAVGCDPRELGASNRLARGRAGDRGRIEQPQLIAPLRRAEGEVVDRSLDLWGERAQTLVVARLTWQVGEQVREPVAGERQKLAVVRQSHEDLGDRQRDELGVRDPQRRPAAAAFVLPPRSPPAIWNQSSS